MRSGGLRFSLLKKYTYIHLLWLGVALPLSYGEQRLLKKDFKDHYINRCCPEGNGNRCLERLVRDEGASTAKAACIGSLANAISSSLGSRPGCGGGNEFGIHTAQYLDRDWVQDDFPQSFQLPPKKYDAEDLAISSHGCDKLFDESGSKQEDFPGWQRAREKCKIQGYKSIRLYVDLSIEEEDTSDFTDIWHSKDPWNKNYELNVRRLEAEDLLDLRRKIAALAMSCYVIDYLYLGSHGQANTIVFSGTQTEVPVWKIFMIGVPPCALSPNAKIQFVGCNVACGSSAQHIQSDAKNIYLDPAYRSVSGKGSFENVRLLFNTSPGNEGRGLGIFRHGDVYSKNDIGLEYSIKGEEVKTDPPLDAVPACPKD